MLYRVRDLTNNGRTKLTDTQRAALAARFQDSVCEVLARKVVRAAMEYNAKEIHLAGGVSANGYLRAKVAAHIAKTFQPPKMDIIDKVDSSRHPALRFPPIALCTDNAAMIGSVAYHKYKRSPSRYRRWRPTVSDPNLKIKNW